MAILIFLISNINKNALWKITALRAIRSEESLILQKSSLYKFTYYI